MAGQNEGMAVVVEKCGLDMSLYQDLANGNGISHVEGDSGGIDNSYVFVGGGALDLHESASAGGKGGISDLTSVVPNGGYLEPGLSEGGDGIAESEDLSREEKGNVVIPVMDMSLEMSRVDGGLGNPDAESVEVRTESAPCILIGEEQGQVASTDSVEQPIGGTVITDLEPEVVVETSIQPLKSQESEPLLDSNTGVGGSVELKDVPSFVHDCGDHQTETTEGAVSRESVESSDINDSREVGLNMNSESSQCKDVESVALGIDYAKDENKETIHISCERSDELPHDLGSRDAVFPASAEAGQDENLEGLELCANKSDNHSEATRDSNIETSEELSLGQDSEVVISKANAESGENKDSESAAPDSNNTSEGDKETMDTIAETSDVLSVGQDSQDLGLEANSLSGDVSGSSDVKVKEAGDEYKEGAAELEMCNKSIEVQCKAMELQQDPESDITPREDITLSPNFQESDEENQETKRKQCETSDDLTEVEGAPNIVEADVYQLEETESEKSIPKGHDCKVEALEAPACQSEDVKIMAHRSDLQLEAGNAEPVEECGTTQVHEDVCLDLGVCQPDVDNIQESDSADIEDNHINSRMQHTINKSAVVENVPDPASCENGFDSSSPELKETAPQHEEPCERTDGSVNLLFGSLRSETNMNSKPVKSNGSLCLDNEDATSDHDVEIKASILSEDTIITDDGLPSDCQDVAIVHEIDLQAPRHSRPECTNDASASPSDDTRSGNIKSGATSDDRVTVGQKMASCLANGVGTEADTCGPIDSRAEALNIPNDDCQADDLNLASKVESASASVSRAVHTNSDSTVTMVLETSDKEHGSDLFSVIAEVKGAGDDLNGADKNKEVNLISQDIGAADEPRISEVSADLKGSLASATAGQEVKEAIPRPFSFLVKLPRFDDEKLREQIRHAQFEVDEKTQLRDAFRTQIQNRRPNLHAFGVAYDAAVSEEIDARRLLKATRNKIESLQSLIGRMKNAISVEDINARIYNIEHRMQHETLSLKEEKQSIREIKQLKQHREYLASNIGSQDEIQQALDQKDQNEDRLKALKKELVELKKKVSTAQAAATTVGKKYESENKLIQELQNQYRVANDVRQSAYENLSILKRKLFEKNEYFRKYKNDFAAASDYASSRNRTALHRLCAGQTEMVMELWNNDDEFRKEYVRCNLRSTVRRLGTVEGRSLGPNEEPPKLPSFALVRVDRSTSNSDKSSPIVEAAVEKKTEAKIANVVIADRKPVTDMTRSVKQVVKVLEPARSRLENGLANSSGSDVPTGTNGVNLQVKEEHDSARKVEDTWKEVETASLKEQGQLDEITKAELLERKKLDEITKAKEAVERKKRIAEKAQIRAELRAQKEAEQREKEREKRLRKKERRRAGEAPESSNHGEIETSSEAGIETVGEPTEAKENSSAVARRSQKPSQFVKQSKSKTIPPPLRNRNRRKLQQWVWVIITSVLVIALFLLGNIGVFNKVRQRRSGF